MALHCCAGVGTSERIRMIGHWLSDELYPYRLHVQAQHVIIGLAAAMLLGSFYQMEPG